MHITKELDEKVNDESLHMWMPRIKKLAKGHRGAFTVLSDLVNMAGSFFLVETIDEEDNTLASAKKLLDYFQACDITGQKIFDLHNYCADKKPLVSVKLLEAGATASGLSVNDLHQIIDQRKRFSTESIKMFYPVPTKTFLS